MNDTIAAIATASGRGGIGVIRISGPEALVIAKQLLPKREGAQEIVDRQATFCRFLSEDGAPIDRGIFIYYPAPASYTGEHVVELQGHGGRVVMTMLLERVLALGARQACPGEFTERAFVNGKIDLVQAEAVAALIDSVSSQAARSAMRSLEGQFSDRIDDLSKQLIHLRTLVEGELDFFEEDGESIRNAAIEEKIHGCGRSINVLIGQANQGAMLSEGLTLAIVGRPNVGKSSLFNQLVKRDAAIVSDAPGTTRDRVEVPWVIGGVPVTVTDTAGLRAAGNAIEAEGIRRALDAAQSADLLLLLVEYDETTDETARHLSAQLRDKKMIVVKNKVDLADNAQALLNGNHGSNAIFISAKTGDGIDMLRKRLGAIIGIQNTGEDNWMARTRHLNALKKARQHLSNAEARWTDWNSLELLAEELRLAHRSLGTITGEFAADDLLGEIFSTFCIGK